MADQKTVPTGESVSAFLKSIDDDQKRADCQAIHDLMKEVTGFEPKIWARSMVGFGDYHYKYASGREGDWFLTGFAPRKKELTLYIMSGFKRYESLMAKLGKYRTGVSCLYVKNLTDIDTEILKELVAESVDYVKSSYE